MFEFIRCLSELTDMKKAPSDIIVWLFNIKQIRSKDSIPTENEPVFCATAWPRASNNLNEKITLSVGIVFPGLLIIIFWGQGMTKNAAMPSSIRFFLKLLSIIYVKDGSCQNSPPLASFFVLRLLYSPNVINIGNDYNNI